MNMDTNKKYTSPRAILLTAFSLLLAGACDNRIYDGPEPDTPAREVSLDFNASIEKTETVQSRNITHIDDFTGNSYSFGMSVTKRDNGNEIFKGSSDMKTTMERSDSSAPWNWSFIDNSNNTSVTPVGSEGKALKVVAYYPPVPSATKDVYTDGIPFDFSARPPTPAEPTPARADPTPTPTDPTPTPANPTPTPSSQITKAAQDVIDRIKELNAQTITLEKKATVQSIRTAYNALSDTEKAQVSNYNLLVQAEATIAQLEAQKNNADTNNPFTSNTSAAQTGTPVYYASNIHAGKDFYLDSLKNNYNLTFSDDFASVMDEIEKEYKEKNKVADASDVNGSKTTTSADSLLVRNWQDILAVYVYQQSQDGKTEFTLDSSCKKDLAKIFAEMNPIVRDKQDITHVTYANRKINYYIKKNKIAKKDRTILKKYVETDCKLLCAVVTAANGFVRESVGDDVSEERVNVISAAYSLVGCLGSQ